MKVPEGMYSLCQFKVGVCGNGNPIPERKADLQNEIWELFILKMTEMETELLRRFPNNKFFVGSQDQKFEETL